MLTQSAAQAWGSGSYYLASAACVTLTLLPFCICMGATFPLAMAGIRQALPDAASRSFSYLYVANVVGATVGTLSAAPGQRAGPDAPVLTDDRPVNEYYFLRRFVWPSKQPS